jgi:hypothetical protein
MGGRFDPQGIDPEAFTGWVRPTSVSGSWRLRLPTIIIDETDIADRAATNLRCQFGDFVIGDFRCGIENAERSQGSQPP